MAPPDSLHTMNELQVASEGLGRVAPGLSVRHGLLPLVVGAVEVCDPGVLAGLAVGLWVVVDASEL